MICLAVCVCVCVCVCGCGCVCVNWGGKTAGLLFREKMSQMD